MKILVYSFNDKIGDGLQKITFIQQLKAIYPKSIITYTTSQKTTLKTQLSPLVEKYIDRFIELNQIDTSLINVFKKNDCFEGMYFDLIIDLQKVVLRTLKLKKIKHGKFFSATANFLFSDFKNSKKLKFKKVYIERFYFNILTLISGMEFDAIPNIQIPYISSDQIKISNNVEKNIAIAPGAGHHLRRWPLANYISIAKKLKSKGYNIYFFIGPDEEEMLPQCIQNGFECPEWENGKLIKKDILFTMNLAKKMKCLLCNDGGTAWMFEFADIKTFKIFGITDEKKFARPNYSTTIQISGYGYSNLNDFPIETYNKLLNEYLNL